MKFFGKVVGTETDQCASNPPKKSRNSSMVILPSWILSVQEKANMICLSQGELLFCQVYVEHFEQHAVLVRI